MRGSPDPWLDPGTAVACWGADLGGLLAEPPAHGFGRRGCRAQMSHLNN